MSTIYRFVATTLLVFTAQVSSVQLYAAEPPVKNTSVTEQPNPQVALATDLGTIVLELYPAQAPVTVENFLHYVNDYHYDGTLFHRVISGFMIQGGGYGFDLYPREPGDPIINESTNGLKNKRGTVAMARVRDPDSAKAQFFINLANNKHLNSRKDKLGYTVFGQVIAGMSVVDKIAKKRTRRRGTFANLPIQPIMIHTARVVKPSTTPEQP